MRIKTKQIILVIFSSAIIALIMISTIVGYSIYLQWKEDVHTVRYRDLIYKLTAEIFRKDIEISGVKTEFVQDDLLPGTPILEGKIKNNSPKAITSLTVELVISRPDGYVLYKNWYYPLEEAALSESPFFSGRIRGEGTLAQGDTVTFRLPLKNCPAEVLSELSNKDIFAKKTPSPKIKIGLHIAGASVS